jgi:hypothetical protein
MISFDHPNGICWIVWIMKWLCKMKTKKHSIKQKGQQRYIERKQSLCCYKCLKVMLHCKIFWDERKLLSVCHTIKKIIQAVTDCACVGVLYGFL